MTDSMNFGPEWLRNLSSEGSTGGGTSSGTRYQLAEYRYGREEMLALFEKNGRPPSSLCGFAPLYSEQTLPPLSLTPPTEDDRVWQSRSTPAGNTARGRGGSLERGGRISRGRGSYQSYGRNTSYESGGGWGNGEQPDWSPRKDYNSRSASVDNWRRNRSGEEDDGWRSSNQSRGSNEKWVRQSSWRDGDNIEERGAPPERGGRGWHEGSRGLQRRHWEEDHLPEWATENLAEGGGTFDSSGAFHGSDDEQLDGRNRKDGGLQKTTSQQNITNKSQPTALSTSKSATSLSKSAENGKKSEVPVTKESKEVLESPQEIPIAKENSEVEQVALPEKEECPINEPQKQKLNKAKVTHIGVTNGFVQDSSMAVNRVEEDFDRLQEDLVLKLVVDEEPPKTAPLNNFDLVNVPTTAQAPPNLAPPTQDKWYYEDPQGEMQGPFAPSEMAEWYRAGYFINALMVRRQCDERFWMLGDLVSLCGGNPFLSTTRIAPLKADNPKLPQSDMLHYQLLQTQLALRQATSRGVLNQPEPWNTLTNLQQRELLAQQMLAHQQINPELTFLQQQQQPTPNPLMHMINQIQQAKTISDKPSNTMPTQLDPIQALVHQMGGLQSLQNRLPTPIQPTGLPPSLATGALPTNLTGDNLATGLTGLQPPAMPGTGLPIPNMPGGLMPGNIPARQAPLNSVDSLNSNTENDPIKSLLRQLQSKQQQQQSPQMDSLWQQNQFNAQQSNPPQWQKQPDVPITVWERQTPSATTTISNLQENVKTVTSQVTEDSKIKEKEQIIKEDPHTATAKEQKKKKELEEKQMKKEAEEKRKQEQKKQEAEKKMAEEKRKKEEEHIRKELEKAKKEAEEKRLRELEEKRRLKEQRKAEEEARKKAEEQKKVDEEERLRRETKEKEELSKKQIEMVKQTHENVRVSKVAPWSQSNTSQGTSLAEIQKAEREKRAEQQAALLQQRAYLQMQEQQRLSDRQTNLQLKWASQPMEVRKVKSLAEIQAEEQERLAKQAAEARLVQKEKEAAVPAAATGNIWSGQNLSWANTASTQWSSNNSTGGFWDEISLQKSSNKPSTVFKSSSATAVNTTAPKQTQKHNKSKTKKEEQQPILKVFNNGPATDEFTNWCIKALSNINSSVDVPTFVSFLRDIESALDVREYCKEYLGDSNATQQFATQFLEKRRSYKPKTSAHKDDMCSPAPAITPSTNQHSNDFQEVKGKSKKSKKNKMQKVDSRILGFNVTAAQDRINVGDRDYVDN